MKTRIVLPLLIVIALSAFPLFFLRDAEFGGADGEAENLITEMAPDYRPWFAGLWEPPSGEVESLLFSLQAAFGAGVVFYVLGYYTGKKSREKKNPIVRS